MKKGRVNLTKRSLKAPLVVLMALLLFAAACSSSDDGEDAATDGTGSDDVVGRVPNDSGGDGDGDDADGGSDAPPPTEPSFVPETQDGTPFLELDLDGRIEALLSAPNTTFAQNVASEMGLTGEQHWGPWLLDLMRLGGTQGVRDTTTWAFEQISGIRSTGDFNQDFVAYGTWLRAEQIHPGDAYHDWKRRLFSALIQPEYFDLLTEVRDPLTLAALQWGGVRRGGIPELNNPAKLTVAEADFMTDDELILGVVIEGQAVSYPLRFMARHELTNDVISGIPVSLGYCTLCRTGVMFDGRVDDGVLTFQTSGLLLDSNKVMIDNQTESLWNHLAGRSISGLLEGTVLNTFPIVTTRWSDWVEEQPDTLTLAIPEATFFPGQPERPPITYDYTPGAAYANYYANDNLWFPSLPVSGPFDEKTGVVTLSRPGGDVAFDQVGLEQSGPFVISLGGDGADGGDAERLVVVPNIGGARVYLAGSSGVLDAGTGADGGELVADAVVSAGAEDLVLSDGTSHARVVSGQSFWFAWSGLKQNSLIWLADGSGTVKHA